MTIFDSIRYRVSIPPTKNELNVIPDVILNEWIRYLELVEYKLITRNSLYVQLLIQHTYDSYHTVIPLVPVYVEKLREIIAKHDIDATTPPDIVNNY